MDEKRIFIIAANGNFNILFHIFRHIFFAVTKQILI